MFLLRVSLFAVIVSSPLFTLGRSERLDRNELAKGVVGASSATTRPDLLGAYRFPDGRIIAIRPSSEEGTWRYIDFTTGESHKLYPSDSSHFHSADDWDSATPIAIRYWFEIDENNRGRSLIVRRAARPSAVARRLELREETTTFRSGDIQLFGKLVLPATGRGPFPVVVFVHGSDDTPSVDRVELPYLLAPHGIATFVFDKRGTGRSEGRYTQLFHVLADDVISAVHWLQSRPEIDEKQIGLAGFSQGGWIAPLAAQKEPAIRFVLVAYGLAMSVADEDRLEGPLQLKARGFGANEIKQFEELNGAIHKLAENGFSGGWSEVEAKIAQYSGTKWFAAVKESQTWAGDVLRIGVEKAKIEVPPLFKSYCECFYDPVPTLESLNVPMLWLIGKDDVTAPPEPTIVVLNRLRKNGKPFETKVFPHSDHGMTEFIIRDGRRVPTKYAGGYFPTIVKWLGRQKRRRS